MGIFYAAWASMFVKKNTGHIFTIFHKSLRRANPGVHEISFKMIKMDGLGSLFL